MRYLTSGESHGPALVSIVEGVPAGLRLNPEEINFHLARRQQGYGRGNRMKIETDTAEILSGVRFGKTIGSPISLVVRNKDWQNWTEKMRQFEEPDHKADPISVPRPGHADFTGRIKYGFDDIRPVIERSSARETAMRVGGCTVARVFLKELGIEIGSYVSAIGKVIEPELNAQVIGLLSAGAETLMQEADKSQVRMLNAELDAKAISHIDDAKNAGDTLGGILEVFVTGLPVGLGSYVQYDRRLEAHLAAAIMSIQAVKGVEVGPAFRNAVSLGSEVHDELYLSEDGLPKRKTNRAGGLEGGMTNGEVLHLRVAMKPIATLMSPLESFDFETMQPTASHIERSDTCAVPACGVIAESVIAPVLANAILEKFGGDHMKEIQSRLTRHNEDVKAIFKKRVMPS
ncbi:MAG: chorismate synthase [Chlorobiales bacterium]|nr:chorismate synthase [Chlorobiales bacterium]